MRFNTMKKQTTTLQVGNPPNYPPEKNRYSWLTWWRWIPFIGAFYLSLHWDTVSSIDRRDRFYLFWQLVWSVLAIAVFLDIVAVLVCNALIRK